ncbi:MAG: carbon-nitrogen hydrolase family protein [Planctomycetota bacterium]|nr:carbon-nitrogen hydrolase family protein [Planctomycetota bacterium]
MMRVAVVQLAIQRGRRTATLQAALHSIDTLAEVNPAPDLVILPAFSDVLEFASGEVGMSARLAGPTVEACGLRARQWGIFVALGFAEAGPDKPYLTGVLLDRDGDVRLTHRQEYSCPGDLFGKGGAPDVTNLILGRVALLAGGDCASRDAWGGLSELDVSLVIGPACSGYADGTTAPAREEFHRAVSEGAKRAGAWAAVADVTTGNDKSGRICPGYSVIVGPDGEVVAAAEPFRPATLWADMQLPAVEAIQST